MNLLASFSRSDIIYDGPTSAGVTTELSEMVKCGINLPSTDMVTPQLMATGVFTWAYGEPSLELNENTCVKLKWVITVYSISGP